ncbi:MAG: hypothetical protein QXG03_12595, partial [Halalkalicoccus sp.]
MDVDRVKEFTKQTGAQGTVWWGDKDDPTASLTVSTEGDTGHEDTSRPERLRLKYTVTNNRTDESEAYDY